MSVKIADKLQLLYLYWLFCYQVSVDLYCFILYG